MRADRLLMLMMLLQTRGRMAAHELASELEVSERTIYRDIDALSAAGVPIYTERGPGGGCSLMDHYRTQLTGLNESELRALFLLSIPAPLADLGMQTDLRGALLKLSAALPQVHREAAHHLQQRIHLDWTWWFEHTTPTPHLPVLYAAVQNDRQIQITYRGAFGRLIKSSAAPYGLVAKGGTWYAVMAHHDQVDAMRISSIRQVQITDETFARPATFDLAAFWERWCIQIERNRPQYQVRARIAPELIPLLVWHFGDQIIDALGSAVSPDEKGWLVVILPFESLEAARERILGYGRAIEVLEPHALRLSVIDFAHQIVDFYTGPPPLK